MFFGMPGPMEMFVLLVISITVIAYWKICAKAGFHGALGLLMLVPIANFFLLLFLAFAEWPALKRQETLTSD